MTTLTDKICVINETLKQVFEFIQSDKEICEDFNEYLVTIGAGNISLNQMEKIFLPYIFEREIGKPSKTILQIYSEGSELENKEIVQSLLNAQSSIFEIKKILKNGFELYNLLNEKTYIVNSLTKMTNFRGIYSGQYIVARIFECNSEFYVIEISGILSHSQKQEAMKYAVMKLMQNPKMLYENNPQKEEEIKATIAGMYTKFISSFGKDIILTTNQYADEIIGAFNDGEEIDMSGKMSDLETPRFFHVKELDNNYANFLENSVGGFSSHSEIYDVAIFFDKECGLYTIPFYETFTKIFEGVEFENKKECIEYFLHNASIPDFILKKVYDKYENFMDVINELLNSNYTFDDLINEYKYEYKTSKMYSSATILYCSQIFSQMFDIISSKKEENIPSIPKVGRNEPCPCGSGKKYKNCCGK